MDNQFQRPTGDTGTPALRESDASRRADFLSASLPDCGTGVLNPDAGYTKLGSAHATPDRANNLEGE